MPVQVELFGLGVGDLNATATEIQILPRSTTGLLQQIAAQAVNHEPAFALHFHQICMLQDLEVMRHRHQFCFQKFGNVADSHFTMAQHINDAEPNRLAERLELVCAGLGLKGIVFHGSHRRNDDKGQNVTE